MDGFDRNFRLTRAGSRRVDEESLPDSLRFGPEGPAREAMAAVIAHPRFAEAARIATVGATRLYQGNRLLNLMINDRGRFMIGLFAVYLHLNGGLTVARMTALCAEQELASAGRARAMLMLMRAFGYLAAAPEPIDTDLRVRQLMPTEALMSLHGERIQCLLDGCAMVMPEAASIFSVRSHRDFVPTYVTRVCELYLSGFRNNRCVPDVRLFAERNAGLVILWDMLGSVEPDGRFPPARILPAPISRLARRFGVSRVHVRRLLQDAVSENFLEKIDDDNNFRALPRLVEMTNELMASAFLVVARCAHLACADLARQRAAA
jgi:hypothetical protein